MKESETVPRERQDACEKRLSFASSLLARHRHFILLNAARSLSRGFAPARRNRSPSRDPANTDSSGWGEAPLGIIQRVLPTVIDVGLMRAAEDEVSLDDA